MSGLTCSDEQANIYPKDGILALSSRSRNQSGNRPLQNSNLWYAEA